MTATTVLETLQELDFSKDLTPSQIETLAEMAFEVNFSEGQVLFREADVGELVYAIDEGQVALDIYVPGQGKTTILTLGPGQIVGWSSLIPSGTKTASARAVTPTKAIAINAAQLREAMDLDHDLGYAILWSLVGVVSSRLKATRLQLLDIFAHSTGD